MDDKPLFDSEAQEWWFAGTMFVVVCFAVWATQFFKGCFELFNLIQFCR
jgi:hypothetical protein